MATKSKDTPLAEITLRKYEPPGALTGRELVRKVCLSLGVLQPGDSRDVVVDVLYVLLVADRPLSSKEVEHAVIDARGAAGVLVFGVAPSNVRRQLFRLRDVFIAEKVKNSYRIRENAPLATLFEEHLQQYYLSSVMSRVKEYLVVTDKVFPRKEMHKSD